MKQVSGVTRRAAAQALSPEDTLRGIFRQARAGEAIRLPEGATAAGLRAALRLDPDVIREIFEQARPRAPPALAAEPPAAVSAGHRVRLVALGACCLAGLAAAGAVSWPVLRQRLAPPLPIAQLAASAVTDPAAFALLAKRAAGGAAEAQFDLATLLDSNLLRQETVTRKDAAASFHWYRLAAAAGFPAAENNLGFAYHTGHGTGRDDAQSARWYRLAAISGLATAQNSLGYFYQNGIGLPQDYHQAVAWYAKSAAQGFAAAENNLGSAYQNGYGAARNFTLAAQWLSRAAAQSEPNAENSLGFLYYTGQGVTQDFSQSFKLFSQAAQQGLASAQVNLGLCYARGTGVLQDDLTAAKWFIMAEQNGYAEGAAALSQIDPPLSPAQLAAAKAAALAAAKPAS